MVVRGEPRADLIGFGRADTGIESKRFLPVLADLAVFPACTASEFWSGTGRGIRVTAHGCAVVRRRC